MPVRYPNREARRARLRRELREIVARIVDPDTEKILLFGSTTRGAVHSTSDLDLLVVRHDSRPAGARVGDLYRCAKPSIALDLFVYTPEELEAERSRSSLLRTALRDAEVVYERR